MTQTPSKVLYTAAATSTGGREGRAVSSDGQLDIALTPPKEMGGTGTGSNPEQLFAAGYAACFNSALATVGRRERVDTSGAEVTAQVGIGPFERAYVLTVALTVRIPGVDLAEAQRLAELAHQVCPYSNATRGNIEVTVTAIA
ncbi:organic hydroperoxide resistance protein [Microlunatus soli]|uniref:Peroxiredoxin, Ohr subfamily n=1 Tax=Microlunatus soli TaxID=630515 RepID=A0A1H1NIT8_9ACTN|nr:organic hydroperoxide resistance protein [Microlunatus soli]SDR98981.1 peroxiredoxin, Ohr subfamily [Microlunatus soli]